MSGSIDSRQTKTQKKKQVDMFLQLIASKIYGADQELKTLMSTCLKESGLLDLCLKESSLLDLNEHNNGEKFLQLISESIEIE